MSVTKHQGIMQGTPEWHRLRAGKLTASCLHEILTPVKQNPSEQCDAYAMQIALERITGKCVEGLKTSAMQKGNILEPIARNIFCDQFNKVYNVTFLENSDVPFPYGASPDALLLNENGGVEIKCLTNPKEYFDLLQSGEIAGCRKLQMDGQMLAGDLDFVDFVIYIEGAKMNPKRYYRDNARIAKIIEAGKRFEEKVQSYIDLHDRSEGFLTPIYDEADYDNE